MQIQPLPWDSELFGFSVAKILPSQLTTSELQSTLDELRAQGVKLVYWAALDCHPTERRHPERQSREGSPIRSCHSERSEESPVAQGFLADHKVTYVFDLAKKHLPLVKEAKDYDAELPSPELESLALESGAYSRFKIDPRVGDSRFEKIYKAWIANSTKKVIAHQVLVIQKQNTIAAMSTLGEKAGRGDIGLLAVAAPFRGQGLGQKIVHASLAALQQRGFHTAQVVTQLTNVPACRLYERCGFVKEKLEYFYHFWL